MKQWIIALLCAQLDGIHQHNEIYTSINKYTGQW